MSRRRNKPQQPTVEPASGDALEAIAAEALHEDPQPSSDGSSAEPPQQPAAPAPEAPAVEQRRDDVKPHLRCPCCWNGLGGVGKEKWWRRINGTVVRRAYSCNQCDCNWSIKVRTISVVEGIEYDIIESGGDQ